VARVPKHARPRCGAKKRDGRPCAAPVECAPDGSLRRRCRNHGGASTGPKTAGGRARTGAAVAARWEAYRARKAAEALTTAEGAAVAEGEESTCSGE
jgi:hypothetical protein